MPDHRGAGLEGLVLEGAKERSGDELRVLVDHARRMRTLMRYAPRKYDSALLEALALNGALKPSLDKAGQEKAIARTAEWLGKADLEARWSGEVAAEGGYLLKRLWRGVTDAYIIESKFLVSAEARKLHGLASEQAARFVVSLEGELQQRVLFFGSERLEFVAALRGVGIFWPREGREGPGG